MYCVADGVLHAFSHSEDSGSLLVIEHYPPFRAFRISGTLAVTRLEARHQSGSWCIVAPCESGGILYSSNLPPKRECYGGATQAWGFINPVAAELGIISAVSVLATHTRNPIGHSDFGDEMATGIVTACIASARLHSIEWSLEQH